MSRNEREMRLKGAAINAVIDLSLQRAKDGVAMGLIADQKHGVLWTSCESHLFAPPEAG